MSRLSIVVFAQVPPPEHGQSRMVMLVLETLRENHESFEVYHVNARFSYSLDDIGESSFGKMLLTAKYLFQAVRIRVRVRQPLLYYVPGPVKWSSVLRDWALLSVLRCFYTRVVFHWHAIGHGEWAHGSERLKLDGPDWMDRVARKISAWILDEPYASISVSESSQKDSVAVASHRKLVVCNGIADPCPCFDSEIAPLRLARQIELAAADRPCFRILFLSHGTLEKGVIDALDCLVRVMESCDPSWSFDVTFAGGISDSVITKFEWVAETLLSHWPDRIRINRKGYVTGGEKHQCFIGHDIFLAPSRWESFGLAVAEAMAHGMPVVAAESDGVKGVLPDGYRYLAAAANPDALAEKLLECCDSVRRAGGSSEGTALRGRFLDLYQLDDFFGNLAVAMISIVKGARAPRAHANEVPEMPSATMIAPCSGGVSPSHDTKADAETPTVTDRRYSEKVAAHGGAALPSACALSKSAPPHEKSAAHGGALPADPISNLQSPISLSVYLADQNPGHDRSYGISRMSLAVLDALQSGGRVKIGTIASKTSQQAPGSVDNARILPWGTRRKWVRLLTDHFHPLFNRSDFKPDIHYFPKGYLPLSSSSCRPSVVTIHDTIIQYDEDHYPKWRSRWEYAYWSMLLKHTLRNAHNIMTVSESSKKQIHTFMDRYRIPRKDIIVTYEPCLYEKVPQPVEPAKENFVIHLASCEPHKRTAHLIRWWHEAAGNGRNMPTLYLIGTVPPEVEPILTSSPTIVKLPFLEDEALQSAYLTARALILPSEIEGFGLPALEAYYLGTPVCFVEGTSVEEVIGVATDKGRFSLENIDSLMSALDEVLAMSPEEIRECGLKLRETYAADKVAERMIQVFQVAQSGSDRIR